MLAPSRPVEGPKVTLERGEADHRAPLRELPCREADLPGLAEAPKGVKLDTPERIEAQRVTIRQQTVLSRAMPPGNLTGMTDEERALLDRWTR